MLDAPRQPEQPGALPGGDPRGWWSRLKDWCRHAFEVEAYDESSLSEEERELLDRLAKWIDDRKLTAAAILWADSNRHFNFITSQALVFAQPVYDLSHPLIKFLMRQHKLDIPPEDLAKLAMALEKRYSIEYFVRRLEAHASGEYNSEPGSDSMDSMPSQDAADGPPPQTKD